MRLLQSEAMQQNRLASFRGIGSSHQDCSCNGKAQDVWGSQSWAVRGGSCISSILICFVFLIHSIWKQWKQHREIKAWDSVESPPPRLAPLQQWVKLGALIWRRTWPLTLAALDSFLEVQNCWGLLIMINLWLSDPLITRLQLGWNQGTDSYVQWRR